MTVGNTLKEQPPRPSCGPTPSWYALSSDDGALEAGKGEAYADRDPQATAEQRARERERRRDEDAEKLSQARASQGVVGALASIARLSLALVLTPIGE